MVTIHSENLLLRRTKLLNFYAILKTHQFLYIIFYMSIFVSFGKVFIFFLSPFILLGHFFLAFWFTLVDLGGTAISLCKIRKGPLTGKTRVPVKIACHRVSRNNLIGDVQRHYWKCLRKTGLEKENWIS